MKEKRFKILSSIYSITFLLSLTQIFFEASDKKIYFFGIFPSIITLVVFFIFMSAIRFDKFDKVDICSTILAACYFLSLNAIYSLFICDRYLSIFLWTKEVLIIFIFYALQFLMIRKTKTVKNWDLLKMTKWCLYILSFFCFISIVIDRVVKMQIGMYLYILSLAILIISSFFTQKGDQLE